MRAYLKANYPWLKTYRDEAVFLGKKPLRFVRKYLSPLRFKALPDGRTWRSLLSNRLHVTILRGQCAYRYRGMICLRNPFDMAIYLMALQELRPATVIEIGTKEGGHAAWLGDMLAVLDSPAQVYSIDIEPPEPPYRPDNVRFLQGDENRLETVDLPWASLPHPWFVIQDASHSYSGIMNSLSFLNKYMIPGDLLVVEDGYLTEFGEDSVGKRNGGPARAIAEFLHYAKDWKIDARYCDFYGRNVTANTNGYLVKR